MNVLPVDYLRECFDYLPEEGRLIWRDRPPHHFASTRGYRAFRRYVGQEAGNVGTTEGYRSVHFGNNHHIKAHRIIIALLTGEWPEHIDHINGVRDDNRLANLRACTKRQNACNRRLNKSSSAGYKGVSRVVRTGRWQARIQHNGKQYNLGMFAGPEEAHAAYQEAATRLHGDFASLG